MRCFTNSVEICTVKRKSRFNNPYNVMYSVTSNIHKQYKQFNICQPTQLNISDRKTNNRYNCFNIIFNKNQDIIIARSFMINEPQLTKFSVENL